MAGKSEKHVDLIIRAKDQSKAAIASATNALQGFKAAQARTAQYRGLVDNQRQTAATARALAIELKEVGLAASGTQVQGFKAAARAAREAKQELLNYRIAARAAAAPLPAAPAAGVTTLAALPMAKRNPLGLRSHELTNLSYQINDVFTQLASGTPIMQVAAQQGGQFAQIFPKATGALLRFAPIVAAVTAALSPFVAKLNEVNSRAATLKEFDALLTRSGEGASYSAGTLADLATKLDAYSGSLKDARTALSTFVGDSVAPAYLEAFGRTALDTAKVLKIDVADAARKVSSAFTGNADAVLALDDELNFLTDSERKHVQQLRQSKKDAEARTYAFDLFARRYGDTAAKMRGPWSQILANFGASWKAFVDYVNFIDWSKVKAEISGLMNMIARLTAMLPGARNGTIEALTARRDQLDRSLAATDAALARNPANTSSFGGPSRGQLLRQRATLQRQRFDVGYQIAAQENDARPRALPSDTTLDPPAAANTSRGDQSGARDAERRAEAQRDFVAGLIAENDARKFQLTLIGQQERAAKIAEAIRAADLQAQGVGLQLTQAQRDTITETVGGLHDAEVLDRARAAIAQTALELAEKRGEVETRAAFVARRLAEDQLSLETEIGRQRAGQLGDLYDAEASARRRAEVEKSVSDLMALRSDLQERVTFLQDTGQESAASALLGDIERVDAALLTAVDSAIAFWTAIGGPEAERAILALTSARESVMKVGAGLAVTAKQANDLLVSGGVTAFDRFAQSIAEGANAFTALRDSFAQFAADFLRQIAQMIVQQQLLNLVSNIGGKAGGGVGGVIAAAANALFRHDGGLVGSGGGFKSVPLAALAGAARYHTGGIAGLKPNEIPAILTRGEEVVTEGDPRHRRNGAGGGPMSLKIVNAWDSADMLTQALMTDAGEKALLNFVSSRSGAFKAAIG